MEEFDTTPENEENLYDELQLEQFIEDDQITPEEEAFMRGYLSS